MELFDYITSTSGTVLLGIDGIVDEVSEIIDYRESCDEYVLMDKMQKFGEMIMERRTGGLAKERVLKRRVVGGFTGNTGRTLGTLMPGDVTMLGMYGTDDSRFEEFAGKCELVSVGEPIVCMILEFEDGKIMLNNLQDLLLLTWDGLVAKLGRDKLAGLFGNTEIACLGYWCNMPDFDNILEKAVGLFKGKRFFFDFGNITKRPVEALKETLLRTSKLNKKVPMTLSLNEHEGALLFSHYGVDFTDDMESAAAAVKKVRDILDIDEIVVHNPHYAVAACAGGASGAVGAVRQKFAEHPVKTAGAGDAFNGGYIFASLGELDVNQRLLAGNAASSFYINNGLPPNRDELIKEAEEIAQI